jgi:hypothetical protein
MVQRSASPISVVQMSSAEFIRMAERLSGSVWRCSRRSRSDLCQDRWRRRLFAECVTVTHSHSALDPGWLEKPRNRFAVSNTRFPVRSLNSSSRPQEIILTKNNWTPDSVSPLRRRFSLDGRGNLPELSALIIASAHRRCTMEGYRQTWGRASSSPSGRRLAPSEEPSRR